MERWLSDVFPGEENIYSEYRELRPRDLAITVAAVLDCALAELLIQRLGGPNTEIESFLGLNGDGRAPVASFGARIQLGLILGILTSRDATILRTIKGIRNEFAHRVNVGFLSPAILKETTKLLSLWKKQTKDLAKAAVVPGSRENLDIIEQGRPCLPEAGEGLLLALFSVYQAYFHRMHPRVTKINRAIDDLSATPEKA